MKALFTTPLLVAASLLALWMPLRAQEEPKGKGVDYTIDTSQSTRQLKAGERGTYVLAIVPGKDRKVHKQAPLSVTLRAPAGIVLDKAKLGRADVASDDGKRVELKVGFAAKSAGEQAIEADATFFICTDKWCQRMTEQVAVTVNVQ